jgi:hypothetical protein
MRTFAAACLIGCSHGEAAAPANSPPDSAIDAPVDVAVDTAVIDAPFQTPAQIRSELIFSGPSRVKTSAAWNANLPKLAGDDKFLYAVHTHFADDVATRFAAIVRRSGTTWTEVARIAHPHQPPGVVMDSKNQLHLVFDCLRPALADVNCFQGGAGTAGVGSRFYHLVFSARDGAGALRFDTYANANEYTALSNGYHGLGVTAGGVVWSLADASWKSVVMGATAATLARPDTYLLYPIHAPPWMYAGEFDPKSGTNAGYPASVAFEGEPLSERFRLTPTTAVAAGAVGSFPSDIAFDDKGVAFILAYRVDGPRCTELRRFDDGPSKPPKVFSLGCIDNYAKLQISRDGTVWVLAAAGDGKMQLGWSRDRGATFEWKQLSITGSGDARFYGATPIKPYTSPGIYDPDRLVFFFAGVDAAGEAQNSYLGTIVLR